MQVRIGACKACDLVYDVEDTRLGEGVDPKIEIAARKKRFLEQHGEHKPALLRYIGESNGMAHGEAVTPSGLRPNYLAKQQVIEVPAHHQAQILAKWPTLWAATSEEELAEEAAAAAKVKE